MISVTMRTMDGLVKCYDFNRFKKIVDVGGSTGHIIKHVLKNYPNVSGICFDLEKVVESMENKPEEGINGRLEWVGGDFFKSVPSGDCYIVSHILHDWHDEACVKILENISNAMEEGAKVLVIDTVINEFGNTGQFSAKALDLEMMLMLNAKERRKDQWEELFGRVGMEVESYIPLNKVNFDSFIIEVVKCKV